MHSTRECSVCGITRDDGAPRSVVQRLVLSEEERDLAEPLTPPDLNDDGHQHEQDGEVHFASHSQCLQCVVQHSALDDKTQEVEEREIKEGEMLIVPGPA
eukprot:514102-Rhodomonas_salina.1